MKLALLSAFLALPVLAQDPTFDLCSPVSACARVASSERPSHAFAYSVAFLAASEAADIASSRGQFETNPILGRGQFGAQQVVIKSGIVGGLLLTEWLIRKRHPESSKSFTIANYAAGAGVSAVAVHNLKNR